MPVILPTWNEQHVIIIVIILTAAIAPPIPQETAAPGRMAVVVLVRVLIGHEQGLTSVIR